MRLAKALMELYPNYPTSEDKTNYEIFNHNEYLNGSEAQKKDIRFLSSQSRYDYEKKRNYFNVYFPKFNKEEFKNKEVLEIGSYTGGSLVYWMECYGFTKKDVASILIPFLRKQGTRLQKREK